MSDEQLTPEDEKKLREIMDRTGVDELTAREILAQEKGEAGDVVTDQGEAKPTRSFLDED